MPPPRDVSTPHARATSRLGAPLLNAFDGDDDGNDDRPGGWVLLFEPELHLGGDVVVPYVAGWRRERMTELPMTAFLVQPPDWLCETLSAPTQALDRGRKLRVYAREQVPYVWFVDPLVETLEVLRLDGETYRLATPRFAGPVAGLAGPLPDPSRRDSSAASRAASR